MRHLIVNRMRIRLVGPNEPEAAEIGNTCPKCNTTFNNGNHHRALYTLCGHVYCLECVTIMPSRTGDCGVGACDNCPTKPSLVVTIKLNEKTVTRKDSKEKQANSPVNNFEEDNRK